MVRRFDDLGIEGVSGLPLALRTTRHGTTRVERRRC
jgi:hypothetical protein